MKDYVNANTFENTNSIDFDNNSEDLSDYYDNFYD